MREHIANSKTCNVIKPAVIELKFLLLILDTRLDQFFNFLWCPRFVARIYLKTIE